METNFSKRFLAYLIDFLIFMIVTTMIVGLIPSSNKQQELNEQLLKIENSYIENEITIEEYFKEYSNILPNYDKENILLNICNLIFIIGYFVIIPVINDGQTIGKKILKIKILKKEGNLTIKDMIIRNFVTTSLLSLMLSSTIIYLISGKYYFIFTLIINFLQLLLVIISIFMIIYRKDKSGVHDLITNTSVVEVR